MSCIRNFYTLLQLLELHMDVIYSYMEYASTCNEYESQIWGGSTHGCSLNEKNLRLFELSFLLLSQSPSDSFLIQELLHHSQLPSPLQCRHSLPNSQIVILSNLRRPHATSLLSNSLTRDLTALIILICTLLVKFRNSLLFSKLTMICKISNPA